MQLRVYALFAIVVASAATAVLGVLSGRILQTQFGAGGTAFGALAFVGAASVAVGLLLGGLLADRVRSVRWLYGLLVAAGLTCVAPPFLRPVAVLADRLLGLTLGALASAASLFAVPGVLLASVLPFGARVAALDDAGARVARAGASAGALAALGLAIGWTGARLFLLPSIGLEATASAVGAAIVAVGVIGLVLESGGRAGWLGLLIALAAISPVAPRGPDGLVFSTSSASGRVEVVESPPGRVLFLDGVPTVVRRVSARIGAQVPRDSAGRTEAIASHGTEGGRALAIGIEGLAWEGLCAPLRLVETDPRLASAARDLLGFPGEIAVEDGRRFLAETKETFDWIVFGLLRPTPPHLVTRECFALAASRLVPDGGLIAVLRDRPGGARTAALCRTLREVLPRLEVFGEEGEEGRARRIAIVARQGASEGDAPLPTAMAARRIPWRAGALLTDDRNPFEILTWRHGSTACSNAR